MIKKFRLCLLAVVGLFAFQACGEKQPPAPQVSEASPAPMREATPAATIKTAPSTPAPATSVRPDLQPATGHLRVVAWNMEWFPGGKPEAPEEEQKRQMAQAQSALTDMKPDVLLMEEVRDWPSAAQLCSVIPKLEVQVVSEFPPRPQNQVIASKIPADSAWSEMWKQTATQELPRGYVFAALPLPGPRFLLTYALHLKSNLGELSENVPMRQAAVWQLLQHAESMLKLYSQRGPCAILVGGDMNTSLDDPKFSGEHTLAAFEAAGFHWTHRGVPPAERVTIPGGKRFGDGCFDHIFTAGLGQLTAAVKSYPSISDHNPVMLDVDLAKADFQPKLNLAAAEKLLNQELPAAMRGKPTDGAIEAELKADDAAGLLAAVGKMVTVQGKVQRVGASANGSITFIDFAAAERGGFTGIVRKPNLEPLATALGGELSAKLPGSIVLLRGTVELFKEKPQIVITDPAQIKILKEK